MQKKDEEEEYWKQSVKILSDPYLLNNLMNFDKDNIDDQQFKKLKNILDENPLLTEENYEKISDGAKILFIWVKGIYNYYLMNSNNPKKNQKIKNAEKKVPEIEKKNEEEVKTEKNNENSNKKEEKKVEIDEKSNELDKNHIKDTKNNIENLFADAKKELSKITKSAIVELKSFPKPPTMLAFTLYLVGNILDNQTKQIIGVNFISIVSELIK